MDDHGTHYVGDSCPGGHADVAVMLEVCPTCGRALPCRHCGAEKAS